MAATRSSHPSEMPARESDGPALPPTQLFGNANTVSEPPSSVYRFKSR